MRTILFLIFLFIALPAGATSKVLNVFNWSQLMPDRVVKQFEKETGITVNLTDFDTNETMYAKLKATDGKGYDIVFPSNYYVERMQHEGMLEKLDKTKIPNIKNLDPRFLHLATDPKNNFSLPYVWSTTGILVNKKTIDPKSVRRFADLWRSQFRNQLLVLDDQRDIFSVAMIVLGYSVNDTQLDHIKQAYQKMVELLPNIRLFNSVAVANIFIDEDVHIGIAWSGDASMAQDENPNLVYIYPEDGFVIELDCISIINNAEHKDAAYQFINFLLRPDIAAIITAEYRYPTPNPAAIKQLPKKLRNNPIINPSRTVLNRGRFQKDIGDANEIFERYWEQLKVQTR